MESIPPGALGIPEKFTDWRPNQWEAIDQMYLAPQRVVLTVCPTGFGKSLAYVSAALLNGGRAVILTSTKGLQSQLLDDFADCGMVDMRGRNSYPCAFTDNENSCDEGPCIAGVKCPFRDGGCAYWDAYAQARMARLVVTNYAYWLTSNYYSEGLGDVDYLICDEAHDAPEAVASFMQIEFKRNDTWMMPLLPTFPDKMKIEEWKSWAISTYENITSELDYLMSRVQNGSNSAAKQLAKMKRISKQFEVLTTFNTKDWVVEVNPKSVIFSPIWTDKFAQDVLFGQVPHVNLTSASVRRKTADMLGIDQGDTCLIEYPHSFPVESRQILHLPTVRVNHRIDQKGMDTLIKRIDQIIKQRLDRKGLIHTISYSRRDFVFMNSVYKDIMMTHKSGTTEAQVKLFKTLQAPKIMVSPSLTTGWDFLYTDAEYQIIMKVPYPDTSNKIVKARMEQDPDYPSYIAAQTLVQATGRVNRAFDDQGETLIIDDNIKWFVKKYGDFIPDWWHEAYKSRLVQPPPPKALGG